MKNATAFTFFILTFSAVYSSPGTDRPVGVMNNAVTSCFSDTAETGRASIHNMLTEIINATGLQPNFEVRKANVLNIEASITRRKRYILYNPEFMEKIDRLSDDKWNSMALLAHEVGHHLNGHTIKKRGSHHAAELEADEFAGFVLARLGATLEQAQKVMLYIASEHGSRTHPSRDLRMKAIQKGWSKLKETDVLVKVELSTKLD